MKKYIFILSAILIFATILIVGCKKDNNKDEPIAGKPTLSLKSGAGLISTNTQAAFGDSLNFEITAKSNGSNNLDKFRIYLNGEVIIDSVISANIFVYSYHPLKSSLENEVWKFVIKDIAGNEAMDSLVITRIPQTIADEQTIQKYITAHNLTAQSTPSGLHYVIVEAGNSSHPTSTSTVTVNYKGYFTDGSIFDESVPGNPIIISLSSVIKGWQEGIQLFGKGGKGILLIPSALGYGSTANYGIPANSVLIFDVELIDFY